MIFIAIVTTPWNGSASRFTDEQYRSSCLICEPNCKTPKSCCHLPVKEPNGDINKNALSSALGAINGARTPMKVSSALKATARSKLKGYYKQAGMDMAAAESFKADGRIWSAGKHNVFVNGKPTKLYVPKDTIVDTYRKLQSRIEKTGVPLGIDHLPDEILQSNEILKKMDLLNVGKANMVGTDGESIYLLDSEVTNQEISNLGLQGELPMYSSVGPIKADPCNRDDIDLILKSADISRIDFVERGGCKSCNVGEITEDLIVLSKLSLEKNEVNKMTEKDVIVEPTVEPTAEPTQTKKEEDKPGKVEEPSRMDLLEQKMDAMMDSIKQIGHDDVEAKLADVEKEVKGYKLEARKAEAKTSVDGYIEAGLAVPAQRDALEAIAIETPELYKQLMASSPKIIEFRQLSKVEAKDGTVIEADPEPEIDPLTDAPILSHEEAKKIIDEA